METRYYKVLIRTADGKECEIDLDMDTLNEVFAVLEDETKQTVKITTYYFFKSTITLIRVVGLRTE